MRIVPVEYKFEFRQLSGENYDQKGKCYCLICSIFVTLFRKPLFVEMGEEYDRYMPARMSQYSITNESFLYPGFLNTSACIITAASSDVLILLALLHHWSYLTVAVSDAEKPCHSILTDAVGDNRRAGSEPESL